MLLDHNCTFNYMYHVHTCTHIWNMRVCADYVRNPISSVYFGLKRSALHKTGYKRAIDTLHVLHVHIHQSLIAMQKSVT